MIKAEAMSTRSLCYCAGVLLCCCAAVLLCCCAAVLLCCCAAVLLCCCAAVLLLLQYIMTMELGSNNEPVAVVFDTGSGSLYTDGYNPATSETSQATDIHPVFGYGSGAVEGEPAHSSTAGGLTCHPHRFLLNEHGLHNRQAFRHCVLSKCKGCAGG
jgi:hypothetical protein